jgi:hypothetical protein
MAGVSVSAAADVAHPTVDGADGRTLRERLEGRTGASQRGIILPTPRKASQLELERSAA